MQRTPTSRKSGSNAPYRPISLAAAPARTPRGRRDPNPGSRFHCVCRSRRAIMRSAAQGNAMIAPCTDFGQGEAI
jgi:hypothetical protein